MRRRNQYCFICVTSILIMIVLYRQDLQLDIPVHVSLPVHRDQNIKKTADRSQARHLASSLPNLKQFDLPLSLTSNYVINPQEICVERSRVELVICVTVSRSAFEHRQAIRDTWGSFKQSNKTGNNTVLVFFIGLGGNEEPEMVENKIRSESQRFQDIVKGDYIDSYKNLTLKSISAVRWVNRYCNQSEFMLKTDADIYIIVPNLLKRLRKAANKTQSRSFVFGNLQAHNKPRRSPRNKWFLPSTFFPSSVFPPYMLGAAYAISKAAYSGITKATYEIKPFPFEDIYITGMCGKHAGVLFVRDRSQYNRRFWTGDYCVVKNMTLAHGYSPNELRKVYQGLNSVKC